MKATNQTTKLLDSIDRKKLGPIFKRHGVSSSEKGAVKSLVEEISLDGGNTVANILRLWEGVGYEEIVYDVADTLSLKVTKDWQHNERLILEKVFEDIVKTMTEEEKNNLEEILKNAGEELGDNMFTGRVGAKIVGMILANTIAKKIIMETIKKTLAKLAAKEVGKRVGAYMIPGLNVIMAAWTVWDIAGPAYRKTIPTVIEIALLRIEHGN